MQLVDRNTFKLIIPKDNTETHGDFFVQSTKGHDCVSYNSLSKHIYHIIDGEGVFIINDTEIPVKPGDIIPIEPNQRFTYMGKMIMTFEMIPNFKAEHDHFVEYVNYEEEKKR